MSIGKIKVVLLTALLGAPSFAEMGSREAFEKARAEREAHFKLQRERRKQQQIKRLKNASNMFIIFSHKDNTTQHI